MRIREIRADGFGALRDVTVTSEAPVTVFYGRNEAGKSTLLHLIRTVLFGFPPRGSGGDRFEPAAGGAHGGTLVLESGSGERIRVSRHAGGAGAGTGRVPSAGTLRVTLPDGTVGGEAVLAELLGGVTAGQFRNLFAVTLSELQELGTLTGGELGGFLHSAGLGVRASRVTEVGRRLAAELDARFRPRGRSQGIGKLLTDADRLDADWRASLAQASRYGELAAELERLTEGLEQAEREAVAVRDRLAFLRAAAPLRAKWVRRVAVRRQLEELAARMEGRKAFPIGGVERQEALKGELERVAQEEARLSLALERLAVRLAAWTPELAELLDAKEQVREAEEGLPLYRSGFQEETERQLERDRTAEALLTLRAELGLTDAHADGVFAGWFSERALTLTLRSEAEAFLERSRGADEQGRRLMAEREALLRSLAEAQQRAKEREAELLTARARFAVKYPYWEAGEPAEASARVRQALSDCRTLETLRLELKHLEERETERRLKLEELRAAAGVTEPVSDTAALRILRLMRGVGWAMQAAGAAGALLGALQDQLLLGLTSLLVLGGFGFAVLLLSREDTTGRGKYGGARTKRPYPPSDVAPLSYQQQPDSPLDERRSELLTRRAATEASLRRALEGLGLGVAQQETAAASGTASVGQTVGLTTGFAGLAPAPVVPAPWEDPAWPDRLESWWNALAKEHQELDRFEERLRETEREADALKEQESRLRRAFARLEADQAMLREMWSDWLERLGLPPELREKLPPAYALEVLERLEAGRELERRLTAADLRLKELRLSRQLFEASSRKLPGLQDTPSAGLPTALQQLRERVADVQELAIRMEEARASKLQVEEELERLRSAAALTAGRLAELWEEAGASGEEELRRFGADADAHIQLLAEEHALVELLATAVGWDRLEELDALLSACHTEALDQLLAQEGSRLAEATAALDESKERKGRLTAECAKLLDGREHAEHRDRQEELLARFREEASQWALYAAAAGLLKRAREVYERERQPMVLREASVHFERMTEGRYQRVAAPLGEERLLAIRADGEAIDSARLSRGTAEQLYLAIRFALAGELARTSAAPMPLILDDIFVNFDRNRLAACVRELGQLANRHQVLLFTCHAHVVEALQEELAPSLVQVVEL